MQIDSSEMPDIKIKQPETFTKRRMSDVVPDEDYSPSIK